LLTAVESFSGGTVGAGLGTQMSVVAGLLFAAPAEGSCLAAAVLVVDWLICGSSGPATGVRSPMRGFARRSAPCAHERRTMHRHMWPWRRVHLRGRAAATQPLPAPKWQHERRSYAKPDPLATADSVGLEGVLTSGALAAADAFTPCSATRSHACADTMGLASALASASVRRVCCKMALEKQLQCSGEAARYNEASQLRSTDSSQLARLQDRLSNSCQPNHVSRSLMQGSYIWSRQCGLLGSRVTSGRRPGRGGVQTEAHAYLGRGCRDGAARGSERARRRSARWTRW
jgi:hypothetical protein